MNKSFCLVACLFVICTSTADAQKKADVTSAKATKTGEDPIKKRVKEDVDAMNAALIKNDLEKVLDLTHPKAIELTGGRKDTLAAMKKGMDEMKAQGTVVQSAESDEPSDPVPSGSSLFIVAPHTIVMKVKGGKLRAKAFVIGVSSDKGKSWKYVNGGVGTEAIKKVIPDLPKELKLPEESKPVFERE